MRALGSGTVLVRRPRPRVRWARRPLPRRVLDAHARLAGIRPGTPLRCTDPSGRVGGTVTADRPPRRGAWRMAVKDAGGKAWLVPVGYLNRIEGSGGSDQDRTAEQEPAYAHDDDTCERTGRPAKPVGDPIPRAYEGTPEP